MSNSTEETLDALKTAQSKPLAGDSINKNWTQSTGLVNYDLQRPAKLIYPVITPLRNMIRRVMGKGGTATHWKSITGININKQYSGVSEGNRGGSIDTTVVDNLSLYKGIGLEDNVTFEADYASEYFDDARARAVEGLLRSVMIDEEVLIIGGNGSLPLGLTPTPTLTASTTGGTLSAATYSVICVALTNAGYYRASISGGIPATIVRTNADGSTDTFGGGSARKSGNGVVTTSTGTSSISASVTPVTGAIAYAWFWGVAGSELLGAITTTNSYVIKATATGTQSATSLPNTDNSVNALVFDGLITQCASGQGSYYVALPTGTPGVGSTLTSDNAGGIVEINTALRSFWDNYRLGPTIMLVNAQELTNITAKVISGGAAPLFRFNVDGKQGSVSDVTLTAGTIIGSYLNKFTMSGGNMVKVMLHPNVPPGTIIFYSNDIPYPLSNVSNPLEMRCRRDYYQIEWPLRTRKYEYGVYSDEVLVNYFPPAFGVLTNIANG